MSTLYYSETKDWGNSRRSDVHILRFPHLGLSTSVLLLTAEPKLGGSFVFSAGSDHIVCPPSISRNNWNIHTQRFQYCSQIETCFVRADKILAVNCVFKRYDTILINSIKPALSEVCASNQPRADKFLDIIAAPARMAASVHTAIFCIWNCSQELEEDATPRMTASCQEKAKHNIWRGMGVGLVRLPHLPQIALLNSVGSALG